MTPPEGASDASLSSLSPAVLAARDWERRTFADALQHGERLHGAREAIVDGARRLTYAQFAHEVHAFARGLVELGVAPGENVALWMSDRIEWLVARWAVPVIGAVLVPVNTRLRDADARHLLAQSESATLIVQAHARATSYFDMLERIAQPAVAADGTWRSERLPALRRVIGLVGAGASEDESLRPGMLDFAAVTALGRARLGDGRLQQRIDGVGADSIAQILYTSGTTSVPKGAMVRHGALLRNNAFAADCLALTPQDRYLSCVPLFTATGTFYTLATWLTGCAMVLLDRFEARRFCENVERERITLAFFVDTIVQDLRAYDGLAGHDLSSLRTGTGAPLPTASFLWVTQALGVPQLVSAYGMSETSNAVVRTRADDPLAKRSTTSGRPVDGVEVHVVDLETGAPLAPGGVGEIRVRGFCVMAGYYQLPDEDALAFDDAGWLRTGDLGEFDADGFLAFRGRVKDMIKPGGFNVATQEIELFLQMWPGVKQAVVVGVPDRRLGEVPYAFLELDAEVGIDVPALIAHCRASIAGYKVPRHVTIVDAWPLTGSQKIRKVELRTRALAAVEALGAAEVAS